MSAVLFYIGPFEITIWNIILIVLILLLATVSRKIINRNLKRYLANANIRVEGKRAIVMRLVSQLVYLVAGYLIFLTLQLQNPDVSFRQFLEYQIIDSKSLQLSFSHIILVGFAFYMAKLAVRLAQLVITQRLRRRKDYDAGLEYVYVQFSKYVIYIIAIMFASKILFSDISGLLTGSLGLLEIGRASCRERVSHGV